MNRFADKVFIVTGAGAGIGLASARLLAENGAKVLITGRREGPLRAAEQDTSGIAALVVDATDPDAAERTVGEAMSRWGRIDGLVNNAGGGVIQPLEAATEAAISDLFKINVGAPHLLASAALPPLAASQGPTFNPSSTFGSNDSAHPDDGIDSGVRAHTGYEEIAEQPKTSSNSRANEQRWRKNSARATTTECDAGHQRLQERER